MTTLRPFFSYYGSKWRAAKSHAPSPSHNKIIEPFAGSAGYSTRFFTHDVMLVDKDEAICGVWDYIIHASATEIRRLPIDVLHVEDLTVCQEAKWLIGFWLNHGTVRPSLTPSSWMRKGTHSSSFWGSEVRERVAWQSEYISHWRVVHGTYLRALNTQATWYIDPPYQKAGKPYRFGADQIDYQMLAEWCRSRQGQVIVCENEGATWLPFSHGMSIKSSLGTSKEVLWIQDGEG